MRMSIDCLRRCTFLNCVGWEILTLRQTARRAKMILNAPSRYFSGRLLSRAAMTANDPPTAAVVVYCTVQCREIAHVQIGGCRSKQLRDCCKKAAFIVCVVIFMERKDSIGAARVFR